MAKSEPNRAPDPVAVHTLVVYVQPDGGDVAWLSLDGSDHVLEQGTAPIATLANQFKPHHCVVLFDASLCTPLRLDLPNLPKHRQAQALKWAAEEFVAGSIEEEHVVAGPRDASGHWLALTMTEASMDALASQLKALSPDAMMPDALCLPHVDGEVSLAMAGDDVLMRWGEWDFGRFHQDSAWSMVESLGGLTWTWYGAMPPPAAVSHQVTHCLQDQSLVSVLAKRATQSPINVLTDRWQPQSALELKGQWAWVAGLASACLMLVLAHLGLEQRLLKNEANALRSEVAAQFQALFPGQPAVGRERELATRELERLQFGQSAGLMALMARIGPTLAGQTGLEIQSLDYRAGELTLGVQGRDVASIDALGRQLSQGGLMANVRSATLSSQGARAEITVTGVLR